MCCVCVRVVQQQQRLGPHWRTTGGFGGFLATAAPPRGAQPATSESALSTRRPAHFLPKPFQGPTKKKRKQNERLQLFFSFAKWFFVEFLFLTSKLEGAQLFILFKKKRFKFDLVFVPMSFKIWFCCHSFRQGMLIRFRDRLQVNTWTGSEIECKISTRKTLARYSLLNHGGRKGLLSNESSPANEPRYCKSILISDLLLDRHREKESFLVMHQVASEMAIASQYERQVRLASRHVQHLTLTRMQLAVTWRSSVPVFFFFVLFSNTAALSLWWRFVFPLVFSVLISLVSGLSLSLSLFSFVLPHPSYHRCARLFPAFIHCGPSSRLRGEGGRGRSLPLPKRRARQNAISRRHIFSFRFYPLIFPFNTSARPFSLPQDAASFSSRAPVAVLVSTGLSIELVEWRIDGVEVNLLSKRGPDSGFCAYLWVWPRRLRCISSLDRKMHRDDWPSSSATKIPTNSTVTFLSVKKLPSSILTTSSYLVVIII